MTSSTNESNDVVVTGLGSLSPLGVNVAQLWEGALSGRVATGPLDERYSHGLQTAMGGQVRGFEPDQYFRRLSPRFIPRSTQLAIGSARMSIEDAGATEIWRRSRRVGVCFGTVNGPRPDIENYLPTIGQPILDCGRQALLTSACQLSRTVAIECELLGPNLTIATACAAGNSAIAYAVDTIQSGRADAMIAGGSDQLSRTVLMLFNRLRSLSPDVVRPFDRNRRGLLLSEGSAALVLERRDHAQNRGARIYCKVAGHGNSADAYHMTAPHPDGLGAIRSMKAALQMAGVTADQIGFVSAHGTGTPSNDLVEAKAIQVTFGTSGGPPVSSLKSLIGHTQGAAAAIEAVVCVLTLHHGWIHPTANLTEIDPDCAINLVTDQPRKLERSIALNNAFGFGGNICCVVFSA